MNGTNSESLSNRRTHLEKVLSEIDKTRTIPHSIMASPGAFLREFYEIWVDNGGKISGRYNRNSLTKINDEWITGERRIKSLHPKLTGQVSITKSDAMSLIMLFLEKWTYADFNESETSNKKIGYRKFPTKNIKILTNVLVDALFFVGSDSSVSGVRIPTESLTNIPIDEQESLKKYTDQCLDSEALINLSRHKTIIGPNVVWKMRTFCNLMHQLYEAERTRSPSDFMLIWVVDIGSRAVDDDNSFESFSNVGFLAMQFVALATFHPNESSTGAVPIHRQLPHADRAYQVNFWRWMQKKAVVIVQNLHEDEYIDYYNSQEQQLSRSRFTNSGITVDQILPKSIPTKWAKKIREIYGRNSVNLDDATVTALVNKSLPHSGSKIKYYAVAQIEQLENVFHNEPIFRQTELLSPGLYYDNAMSIIQLASRYVLRRQEGRNIKPNEDEEAAFGYLASTGFQTLSLRDFIQIYWSSIDLLQVQIDEGGETRGKSDS